MVGALDPDCLAAERDVDRTLIELALERSPLEFIVVGMSAAVFAGVPATTDVRALV